MDVSSASRFRLWVIYCRCTENLWSALICFYQCFCFLFIGYHQKSSLSRVNSSHYGQFNDSASKLRQQIIFYPLYHFITVAQCKLLWYTVFVPRRKGSAASGSLTTHYNAANPFLRRTQNNCSFLSLTIFFIIIFFHFLYFHYSFYPHFAEAPLLFRSGASRFSVQSNACNPPNRGYHKFVFIFIAWFLPQPQISK